MSAVEMQDRFSGAQVPARNLSPHSGKVRIFAGISLVLAGVLNGLSQYVTSLMHGDLSFNEYIRWGEAHPQVVHAEQIALVFSMLFAPFGLLGVAHVCRRRAPVLTLVSTPLVMWGMWGFHNILAMSYLMAHNAARELGIDQAIRLSESLKGDIGANFTSLLPHLVGSFLGLLLLSIACWKSKMFPRTPLVLLVAFLIWDFTLPSAGALEPHVLLAVAWGWMGIHIMRMRDAVWTGGHALD